MWVLIFWIISGYGVTSQQIDFNSQGKCEDALNKMKAYYLNNWSTPTVSGICIQK